MKINVKRIPATYLCGFYFTDNRNYGDYKLHNSYEDLWLHR